jgi:hypothetical protein
VSDPRTRELSRIRSAARAVELRLRAGRALEALPPASTLGLGLVAIVLAARKVAPGHVSELRARELCAGAIAIAVAWVATAALRRLPPRAGTVALDRHHALHDRLSNALAFSALPDADRTPLMEVAIDDACEHAGKLAPSKAAPLRFPRELVASALVGLGVALVAMLEVRTPRREAPVQKVLDPLAMSPDDIELFRDAARELSAKDQSPEVKAAVERFNQLIEDIAQKRLDRTEAFRRMEAIERELLKGAEADKKSLEDALDETGKELARSDLAKPIGESLQKKDLEQAKKAMKDLAARLRDKKPVDKKELERLREALKRAAARKKEALTALNEKRAELKEQLLKKKSQPQDPDAGAPNPEEERLLKKKERELERLDREAEQRERAGRQLDRLDRELSKAAEDLMRDLGMSAQDLEQAAEDINRLQDEQMSEKEKEELRQRLEELRELLRQQGQGGKQRMARLLKFGKRARGKGQQGEGQKGDKGDQGEKGDKGDQEGDDEGEGQDGQSGQNGGKDGQGDKQLVIGPGGKRILISKGAGQSPGQGSGPPQPGGDGQGAGQGQQGTSEGGGEGHGIGSGHDGNVAGKRTDPKMGTADVQAQGLDTQQGPTNSEVILGAAERGFKGSGYKKVFTQYRTVAEQEMNKDTIPDGYRFYVHRYFQLIRPRE